MSFLKFIVVGVPNTVVHYAVYLVMWLWTPYLVAHLIAATVAMSVSYLLNCRYTFGVRPTLRKFLLYPLSNVTNLALSTAAVWALVEGFGVDSRIATLVGGVVAVPATFLVSRAILVRPAPREAEPARTAPE
ncbi:GtrA family protein [Saccharopolyspora cebuensis]|uniref:GtrA family protein n=1 Tax=Saccharopolyspora cebuensis TaxID=418759 RepID=A0ABV4CL74_9PSEU